MFWIQIIFLLLGAFALFLLLYAVGHIGSGRTEKLERGQGEDKEWLLLTHEAYEYGRKGEYWKSIESAEKAIELNPRASEAWRLIGNAYELLGDAMIEVADTPLEKVKFPRPHNEKSEAIFLQCDEPKDYYKKATEAWNKAKEINPEIIIPGYHE